MYSFLILIKKEPVKALLDPDQVEESWKRALLCPAHGCVFLKQISMKKSKKIIFAFLVVIASVQSSIAQDRLSKRELSINGFRNPSVGVEYRISHVSAHVGYYPTAFESGVTTNFMKAGFTYWFLPVGKKENPSSFYSTLAYARGLSKDYKDKNAAIGEVGFRWMAWKGLNLRIGAAALTAKGESLKVNPTPGISYSFFFK